MGQIQTTNIEQFKAEILHFIDFALKHNDKVSVVTKNGKVSFKRQQSDQEYLESIPGLLESINQASDDLKSGKDKGTKVDTSSFKAFKASLR